MDIHYAEPDIGAVAHTLRESIVPQELGATVVGLIGDLGAGKTTLVQALAKELGSSAVVVSPTFVIAKFYELTDPSWDQLVHIDAYRIEDIRELAALGWETLIDTPRTLIMIEWPERILAALPPATQRFEIMHTDRGRHIQQL